MPVCVVAGGCRKICACVHECFDYVVCACSGYRKNVESVCVCVCVCGCSQFSRSGSEIHTSAVTAAAFHTSIIKQLKYMLVCVGRGGCVCLFGLLFVLHSMIVYIRCCCNPHSLGLYDM